MIKRNFVNLALTLLMCTGMLHAEENCREGDRVQVATSNLSLEQELKLQQKFAGEGPGHENERIDERINEEKIAEENDECDGIEKNEISYQIRRHAGVFQAANSISLTGDLIELLDGSLWQVHPGDAYKCQSWAPGYDNLIITQNTSWFFKRYKYKIINDTTGEIVEANLSMGPFLDRVRTITYIDPYARLIQLSDGSTWSILSDDDFIYFDLVPGDLSQRKWLPTDAIIIGANDYFWSSLGSPFILINVNVNKCARAQLVN